MLGSLALEPKFTAVGDAHKRPYALEDPDQDLLSGQSAMPPEAPFLVARGTAPPPPSAPPHTVGLP